MAATFNRQRQFYGEDEAGIASRRNIAVSVLDQMIWLRWVGQYSAEVGLLLYVYQTAGSDLRGGFRATGSL